MMTFEVATKAEFPTLLVAATWNWYRCLAERPVLTKEFAVDEVVATVTHAPHVDPA
jgi:hypothetical protein